jgi:uncharacterized protein with ParB-like and HNH nuclease domain
MKINIENTPRSIADLFFNDGHTAGSGEFTCIGNNQRVRKIIIPIYQREYDWGKDELLTLLINTNEYIYNLPPAHYHNSYFVGTVLLELQKREKGHFELIDGQQRLTTSFLLNYVGYIIALERLLKMPTFPYKKYPRELSNRLLILKSFEDKLFTDKKKGSIPASWNLIFTNAFWDIDDEIDSLNKISERLKIENILKYREPKIHHKNPEQSKLFIDTIKYTKLINKNNSYSLTELPSNQFNERAHNIFDYFFDILKDKKSTADEILGEILISIDNFSAAISYCVLVSDNPDDSFKLFEVLNSTGTRLTIIDKLKNNLYENIVNKKKSLNKEEFNSRWKEILDFISKSGTSNISLDLARSESALIKDKFYEYFSNKTIHLSNNKKIVRDDLFKKEDPIIFYNRITLVANTLASIYSIDIYENTNTPHTLGWYYRVMNKLNYDWGRQVFLGCIILTKHLNKKFPIELNGYWDTPLIDNHSTLNRLDTTSKFITNLSDMLLKIGIIGIINGLSSKKLPTISQDILSKIIDFVRKNKQESELPKLFSEIKDQMNLFINQEKLVFERELRDLKYTKNSDKKYMTLLLYILYNRGASSHFFFEKPTLEHFEPKIKQPGNNAFYYSGIDREDLIHKLGNMILMKQGHNSILGNLTIKEKLKKISNAFKNDPFYGTNVYLNLDPSKKINGDLPPYTNFPLIDKKIAFNAHGAPNKELFELRSSFYVTNIIDMVCSDNKYILSGENYVI